MQECAWMGWQTVWRLAAEITQTKAQAGRCKQLCHEVQLLAQQQAQERL